jgi:hypothetical protein
MRIVAHLFLLLIFEFPIFEKTLDNEKSDTSCFAFAPMFFW